MYNLTAKAGFLVTARRFVSSALYVWALVQLPTATEAQETTDWKAAVSRVVITPEKPMFMAGYASRNRPSEGKEHELFAKCLAVEDTEGNRLVIVTTDLIGIPRQLRDNVNAKVLEAYELPVSRIILNASHTHCGPELRASKASLYGLGEERVAQAREYVRWLESALVSLIGQALEALAPADLRYTRARAGFAMNRRLQTAGGLRNSPNPAGPVDHEVPILRVHDAKGELKAVLFGYACHNTTMGHYKFFGDYAGRAQEYIEERHPAVTALFMMGCGGDQNPYPRSKLEYAGEHGLALANAVETGLQVIEPTKVEGPLRVAASEVELAFAPPPDRDALEKLAQSGNRYDKRRAAILLEQLDKNGKIRDTYSYPLQVTRFGDDILLITMAGEVVVDYSLRLKQQYAGAAAVWVAGYSHDVFGYVPSRRVLLEGGYEGGGAMRYTTLPGPFAPSVEQRIMDGIDNLVDQVTP